MGDNNRHSQRGNMISVFRSAAEKSLSVQQLIDGQKMLVLVLIVVLQVDATRGEELHLYHRERENVVLPCNSPSSFFFCSDVKWFYSRDTSSFYSEVENGKVFDHSSRASRLNIDSSCSLIINNITADDAGFYTCRPGSGSSSDGFVYLNVLSISYAHPTKEDLTIRCSLWRYSELPSCPGKSFRWLDETGTELTGKNDDRSSRQRCFSSLTLKLQIVKNRRFTCQFVEGNRVKVEAQYIQGEPVNLYHRAGDEAVLPCNRPSSSDSCSSVDWIYKKNENMNKQQEVHRGIVQSSPRSARMSLDRNCSLIINNITKEDVGRYSCQPEDGGNFETHVFLNLLIISPSPPDVDPTQNGDVTLSCSLVKYREFGSCPDKSLLWLDQTGSELTGEGDGYKFERQAGCISYLTVNLQSNRRFTCQFVGGNKVKIEAHYESEASGNISTSTIIIILVSIIGFLLLLVALAAVFIKLRKTRNKEDRKTTTENQDSANENHQYDELQTNLTYATVSHSKPSEKIKVQTDEGTVTYSAVRTKKKKVDVDPSDVYSCPTEPQ